MEEIFKYYSLDWFGMISTLLAVWLLGNKSKYGFVSFIVSNILWVGVGILAESYAITIGNLIFLFMNIRALSKWKKAKKDEAEATV
ncbi:MAG: nicotinamide mononucleotide transporter [Ignavibacteriaceae bacterium]